MSDFNSIIRQRLQQHVDDTEETFHSVAMKLRIPSQALYRFRSNGKGLNGENAYKLIAYLGIEENELNVEENQ